MFVILTKEESQQRCATNVVSHLLARPSSSCLFQFVLHKINSFCYKLACYTHVFVCIYSTTLRFVFINHKKVTISLRLLLHKSINHFLVIIISSFGDRFPTENFQNAFATISSHLDGQGFVFE